MQSIAFYHRISPNPRSLSKAIEFGTAAHFYSMICGEGAALWHRVIPNLDQGRGILQSQGCSADLDERKNETRRIKHNGSSQVAQGLSLTPPGNGASRPIAELAYQPRGQASDRRMD